MIIGSLPNADRNNLIPVAEDASGVTTESLIETNSGFSFTIHGGVGLTEGVDGLPATTSAVVGLMERPGTAGPWTVFPALCALWVQWETGEPYDGLPGTVTESWGTFGTEIVAARRLNTDIGFTRAGPRYTHRLSGANYEGWVDRGKGITPRCIVSAPAGGFPFPLRLVMMVSCAGFGVCHMQVRDVMLEGKLGQKAHLTAENKTEWGIVSPDLHLRIYQTGDVPGYPVDIDLP